IVHFEFVPQGITVNAVFYLEVRETEKPNRPRPGHTGFVVTNYLTLNKTPVVRQAPYSPRLHARFTCVDDGSFQLLHVRGR
ncbi:hypothetical protein J6590_106695, partial [Homalodisca vitripennis]